ncbi:MAG: homocysteine S-methyltransferase family protein, partial [Clostridia bacterium]
MDIINKLKAGRLYCDGGYGTSLQALGLAPGELPELWNLSHAETVTKLHGDYLDAGSDIITTNTFGANALKFNGENGVPCLEEIIAAAVSNAKNAVRAYGQPDKYVALDIGPSGRLLKPLGDLDFNDAVSLFGETVRLGVKYGVDLILIETMNDSYETKAAVLAAKENADLPVFVTNAYDESGKLMTGASPAAMVALLEGLRVDALGVNCSLGPDKMLPVAAALLDHSSTPVIVNPNAGLPIFRNGRTEYEVTPDDFADAMMKIAALGATVLGGCCGTTPAHIRALKARAETLPFEPIPAKNITVTSSYTHAVILDKKPVLIGERINPTGKPLFKAALREKNYDYMLQEAVAQQEAGADILDVNVGLPEIDEKATLTHSVSLLQTVTDLPLQIDTADPAAMEAALRIYNGKPLINSVNGKKEVMETIFPLAAKYGGAVIALTLDETGIPETADGRIRIAEKIISTAAAYGITTKNLIFDPLAMTISSDTASALVTLECIKRLTAMGLKTSLGVSNVSFGLPQREKINAAFFTMALTDGLSAAIMNPHSNAMQDVYHAFCALSNLDPRCADYIAYSAAQSDGAEQKSAPADTTLSAEDALKRSVIKGLKDEAAL